MSDMLIVRNMDSHIWLCCTECSDWRERLAFDDNGTFQKGNGQIIEHGLHHFHTKH